MASNMRFEDEQTVERLQRIELMVDELIAQKRALVEALKYVLQDEGLIPRATSECRKVVRAALTKAGETK